MSPLTAGQAGTSFTIDYEQPGSGQLRARVTGRRGGLETLLEYWYAIADEARRFYGLQFHAEVAHTPNGATMLRNFTHHIAGFKADWTMASFRTEMVAKIKAQVGERAG